MKIDKSLINAMNKANVLTAIRDAGQIYKAEIARLTSLSIPTVMKIADEFAARGLIRDIGKGESSGGKPPQLLEFVPDRHYVIGVDIGTTNINCIWMDMSARIVHQHVVPTQVDESPERVIGRIVDSIRLVIDKAGADASKLLGIGLGMPGLLDTDNGTVLFSPDFKWEMVELLPAIRSAFPMPVRMDNVTRAMALGQKWFGYAKGSFDSFVCINLGHGIGAALYLDGRLYSGGSGSSGELGHMMIDKDGPLCVCGNVGCLEALASGNAIANQALEAVAAGRRTSLAELARLEAKDVFAAAASGDVLAMEIVSRAAEHIGTAIAHVVNLLDPEAIILEGGLSRAGEPFIEDIRRAAARRQMKYAGRKTRIAVSGLGENSAAIGAATLLLKRFFEAGGDAAALEQR